ncbi:MULTISPECIES: Na+/H+ antiporter subunit E [unclassified Pseudonocardia]|uniref:Na+/H+ antiporter subunit E n=1 Tax=unclassified Pseudonocardia TaxID=2619320 RepID=UPI000761926C|nr:MULTISPECIES: Na+/H+ antiporter subunit E [unclassified Pseudonocardia]
MSEDRTIRDGAAAETSPEGQREADMGAAETGTGLPAEESREAALVPEQRPATVDDQPGDNSRIGSWPRRIPQVLALALVWVLLWGSLAPTAIVGGLVIGLLVTVLFPLPLLPDRMPVRPLKLLRLAGYLVVDLVVSGIRVSVVTVAQGRRARSGIVGLPLCATSDRTVTMIVAACALSPGSFTLQIDRRRGRWYVFALGLHRAGAVDRLRKEMMNLQMRVIDAVGTDADVEMCRAAVAAVAEGRDTGRAAR